jgi:hypothetical protein
MWHFHNYFPVLYFPVLDRSAMTAMAALRPLTAITLPPGWVPAPHKYSPGTSVREEKRRSHI